MRYLLLTNVQHSKNCFERDHLTPFVFIVELPKFHNALGRWFYLQLRKKNINYN